MVPIMGESRAIIILTLIAISVLMCATVAKGEISVGVKKGDWMEYNVTTTGSPPKEHNIIWARMEILDVQGTEFSANVTTEAPDGTLSSLIRFFNIGEGQVSYWIIIPANLDPGDSFYDKSMNRNVTIEGEKERVIADATRTITYANTPEWHKEWDKSHGIYVATIDSLGDYTINATAIATNMWNPDTFLGINQMVFYGLAAVILVLAVLMLASLMIVARTKKTEKLTLSPSLQGKLAVLTIIIVILVEIGTILFFPFNEIGMSFAEFNLIMQTFWTGLALVSMWFRKKGHYFVHEITMLIVMCAWFVGFSAVLFMGPFSSLEMYVGTPLRWVMNILHAVFSIPALVFGTWLVALWRPGSTTFATKSRRIAQLTTIFWILSYVVGVLDGMLLHTTIFG